jgi:hypothetical protein
MSFHLVPAVDLAANASIYERRHGLPDASVTQIMWALWSALSFLAALACCLVHLVVIASPRTRSSAFNLCIAALMVPDVMFSLNCGITCLLNHLQGSYVSVAMSHYQTFYKVFGICGSF